MVSACITSSRLLAASFVAVHAVAAATLLALGIPAVVKIVLACGIAASLWWVLWRYAFVRAASSIIEIEVTDQASGAVRPRGGDWQDVEILCTSYVTPWLTVVDVRRVEGGGVRHALLVRDN